MKKRLSSYYLRAVTLITVMAGNILLFAQPPGGPPPGGGGATGSTPPCWEPECVPIDAGLGFLIVAGAAFGAKKIYGQLR